MHRVQPNTWVASGNGASREKSRGGTPQKPQTGVQAGSGAWAAADWTLRVMRLNLSMSGMRAVHSGVPKGCLSWLRVGMTGTSSMSASTSATCRAPSHLPGPTSM